MKLNNTGEDLRKQVEKQSRRMKKAERERPSLMRETVYVGTLGLLLVLPIVGGAYLGLWLDKLLEGYATRWTISFILIGVIVGASNVYLFIKQQERDDDSE